MKKNKFIKPLILILMLLIIVYVFHKFNLASFLSVDGFNHYHQQILDYEIAHFYLFIAFYILSYIILIAACIPGTIVFDLIAGFIFGVVWGSLIVIFSYATGAIVNFLIVKAFFSDSLQKRFGHFSHIITRNGTSPSSIATNLIGLRFIPVIPFWILNIVAAIVRVSLPVFIVSTVIGIIPTSVIYVVIGNSVKQDLLQGKSLSVDTITNPYLWIPLCILGLMILLPNIIKFIKHKIHHRNKLS